MIIEGLLTTQSESGQPHVAPMGPVVNENRDQWTLRPFQSSTTFRLLQNHPIAVFHVIDDVLPVVQSALGMPVDLEFQRINDQCWRIVDCCQWFALEVTDWDTSDQRTRLQAKVVDQGIVRPFWGWNRAKHAVLEATILATRLHLADRDRIADDLAQLESAVKKTAGQRELLAWSCVMEYIRNSAQRIS